MIPYENFKLYIVYHKKEKRRMACLYDPITKERHTISYARYLMSVHLKRLLKPEEHVDHINNDKSDDRIENLQLLTQKENNIKHCKETIPPVQAKKCVICGNPFIPRRRNAPIQTCSRRCGGIKSHLTSDNSL